MVRSAWFPVVIAPEESSTRFRMSEPGVPLKFAAGSNRIRSVAAIRSVVVESTRGAGILTGMAVVVGGDRQRVAAVEVRGGEIAQPIERGVGVGERAAERDVARSIPR